MASAALEEAVAAVRSLPDEEQEQLATWILELIVQQQLLSHPAYKRLQPGEDPRAGWEEEFRLLAEGGHDRLLDDVPYSLTTWDDTEWEW